MIAKDSTSHVLIVEGKTDLRVLPYLMEKNGVAWPDDNRPVRIKDVNGITSCTKAQITVYFKEPGVKFFGIILDADKDANAAWDTFRGWFKDSFSDIPAQAPAEGFISSTTWDGIRVGAWIMPDNMSDGMLETFLKLLVPDDQQDLWSFAEKSCTEAKSLYNAPFKHVHHDKASIHTFLAWQDEPGRQLHEAFLKPALDPKSPASQPFVKWFRDLFQV